MILMRREVVSAIGPKTSAEIPPTMKKPNWTIAPTLASLSASVNSKSLAIALRFGDAKFWSECKQTAENRTTAKVQIARRSAERMIVNGSPPINRFGSGPISKDATLFACRGRGKSLALFAMGIDVTMGSLSSDVRLLEPKNVMLLFRIVFLSPNIKNQQRFSISENNLRDTYER